MVHRGRRAGGEPLPAAARPKPGVRGRAYNHAAPGARATALSGQAGAAVRDQADYVTVLIGANDACRGGIDAMTPVATFRDQVDRGLRVLREGRPKARVLVVSIPDLYRLWEVGHTEPRAVRAWAYGICPALLADPTSAAPADGGPPDPVPASGSTPTTPSSARPAGRTGRAAGTTAGRRTGCGSTSTWSTPWTGSTRTPPARIGSPR